MQRSPSLPAPYPFALEGPADRRMMVVVTVESPRGRTTLAAPDDVPVEQLLPALIEACRCEREASRWSLRPRGEAPLGSGRTLEQAGVYRGAVLELSAEGPPSARPRRRHLAPWAEVGLYHAGRVGADTWEAARRALAGRAREATAGAPPPGHARAPDPDQRQGQGTKATRPAVARRQRFDPDRAIADAMLQRGLLIAVLGSEPGAGVTTVTALLATLLARLRPDPVTAVDTDTVSGSLSLYLTPGRRASAADLQSLVAQGGAAVLRQQLAVEEHGLLVLPAPILAGGAPKFDQPFYTALLAQLTRSADLAVVDCGVADLPGGRAALASADLAVVTCRAEEADSQRLSQSLRAARVSCRSVVVVRNGVQRSRAGRDVWPQVPGADHTVSLSHEPAAAARLRAAAFNWQAAPKSWQAELRALATALLIDRPA